MAAATGVWEGERGAGCRAEDSHYQQRKQKAKVCWLFPENGSMGLGTRSFATTFLLQEQS